MKKNDIPPVLIGGAADPDVELRNVLNCWDGSVRGTHGVCGARQLEQTV